VVNFLYHCQELRYVVIFSFIRFQASLKHNFQIWLSSCFITIQKITAPSMSADFISGFVSGSVGIAVGNPLDIIKVRLQAGQSGSGLPSAPAVASNPTTLLRGMLDPGYEYAGV
jgi:Mitochondrial carrier protein